MDKNAIKKFAVWARTELIARVSLKGVEYGITEDNIEDANVDSAHGKVLTADEKKQRQALIAEINDKGYKQVMEEVAYTWFNRFSALRFMPTILGMVPLLFDVAFGGMAATIIFGLTFATLLTLFVRCV